MEQWGLRLKQLREERNLTQEDLAVRSDLNRSYLSRMEIGTIKSPGFDTVRALAKGLGMNLDELNEAITGETLKSQPERTEEAYNRLGQLIPIDIPIYPDFTLHFGEGVEPVEHIPYARARGIGKNIRGFIGHGNCLSPKIEDGDVVIIDRDAPIEHGQYAVCLVGDEVHIGQLKKIGDELFLVNKNGQIPIKDCQASVRVIEIIRRL